MAAPLSYRLLPDPDVHDLLARTLERVNKACNGARTRALTQRATGKNEVKTLVKEELDKFKLPITFSTAESDDRRLKLWKMNPIFRNRTCGSARSCSAVALSPTPRRHQR